MNQVSADRIPPTVRGKTVSACHRFLDSHKAAIESPDHPGFKRAFAAFESQEINLHALITPGVRNALTSLNESDRYSAIPHFPPATSRDLPSLLSYIWYLCWSKPESRTIKDVLLLAQNANGIRHEAEITFSANRLLGLPMKRHLNLMKTCKLFESLGDWNKALLAECLGMYCLELYMDSIGREEEPPESISEEVGRLKERRKALVIPASLSKSDEIHAAALLYGNQVKLGNPDKILLALRAIQEAKHIYEQLEKPFSVAECAFWLARGNLRVRRYIEALSLIEEALEGYRTSAFGEAGHVAQIAASYLIKARVLKGLGRWDEVGMGFIEECLELSLKVYREVLGYELPIAFVLDELGEVYVRRQAWREARVVYSEAIKRGEMGMGGSSKGGDLRKIVLGRWKRNLVYVEGKEKGLEDGGSAFEEPLRF